MACLVAEKILKKNMVITGATLTAGIVLAVGSHFYKAHAKSPKFPFFAGLALSLVIPTIIIALVLELILLFAWNPLIWME